MNYKVYFHEVNTSIILIDLYDDDWDNFDKAFDDAFEMVEANPGKRYDIILKISKIHTKGQPLQHFNRVGNHLKKHPEVVGLVNVTSNPPPLLAFFDAMTNIVVRIAIKRKVPTSYAKTIEEALNIIEEWRVDDMNN